jgi:mRNA interferase RelE/StbE
VAHDLEYSNAIRETLDELEREDARRIIKKLDDILDFPTHFLDRLKNHPGYKLRVGDFRVLIDWDKDDETLYAIDVFERKHEYRELGKYRVVWGSWSVDSEDDTLRHRLRTGRPTRSPGHHARYWLDPPTQ